MKFLWIALLLIGNIAYAGVKEDQAQADKYYQAQDYKKAYKKYRTLARSGDMFSQFRLSQMYYAGQGTKVSQDDAYGWSVLAAETGAEKMVAYRDELFEKVDDKAKAKATAEKLMAKYGQAALDQKMLMMANRRTRGTCTGSRLSCGPQTQTLGHDYRTDAGTGIQMEGGD